MEGNTLKILSRVLTILTLILLAIDIFEMVTKGTVSDVYLLATAGCACCGLAAAIGKSRQNRGDK